MRWAVCLLPFTALLAGCEILGARECPLSIEPAIVVWITDAETGEARAATASGYVAQGEYVDSLRAAAWDRDDTVLALGTREAGAGLYRVVVEAPGYERWLRGNVAVTDGECGVETRELDAELEPTGA